MTMYFKHGSQNPWVHPPLTGNKCELLFLSNSFNNSDTDYEYEQIKAKLEEFDNTDAEVEDFEDEGYLVLRVKLGTSSYFLERL